ncbi:cytochrome P450 [Glomus cerebriforme]|uniref:Cytochrome P450 n=1 Tax=Glomus cerebriforme TaxID=658196 RepID=A0A397RZJ0_9GLOM|nr:cytochrome P450 [Glomus cerebriforme]
MISKIISSFRISEIFSLLIVFITIYVTQYYYRYFTRPNPLPGPFPLPILGNIHQKGSLSRKDWYMSLHKKYGDMFEINLTGLRIIVLCKPDLIENMNVPSTKTKYPISLQISEGLREYGLNGLGVVNNNDFKSWKYHRQFFSQAMMAPSFNYQAIEWTNELWNEMESYWNNLGENQELDLIKWMHRFTNEMIFRISTGVKSDVVSSYYKGILLKNNIINSLNEDEKRKIEESENFIQSIEIFLKGAIHFFMFNKFIRHYVPFIRGKTISLLKNKDYLFDKIYDIIEKRRIEIENIPLDQPLRHDMLTTYITANTPRDINNIKHVDVDLLRPMTDEEIFANILDAIGAGTDTTANMFCFVVYYLGQYPEVKKRLRQELDTVFENDFTKPVTYKDLDQLHYCDAVIKEVTRVCPIAFSIGRVNVEKDKVGGFNWPEYTQFSLFYFAIMRNKDYWTDPEKFDPDRFYNIEDSNKYLLEKQHVKNTFSMFGGGIRICPGRKLAMIELKCLIALVYRKYDLELADKKAPLNYSADAISSCNELIVKFKSRNF